MQIPPRSLHGRISTALVPMPSRRTDLSTDSCRFSLIRSRSGGAAEIPSASASIPRRCRSACRAAASAVVWAIWHPVTKAKDAVAGRPSNSLSHAPQTSSTTASAGAAAADAAFGSQVAVSQSAANAAGSTPPMTQPKKRPPVDACSPPSTSRASWSMTATASVPRCGRGRSRRLRSSGTPTVAPPGPMRKAVEITSRVLEGTAQDFLFGHCSTPCV